MAIKKDQAAKRNLRLVMLEATITAEYLARPVVTLFLYSMGCSNSQVAAIETFKTIAAICLSFPLGYAADRLSRKWANVIGDASYGLLFLAFACATDIKGIIACQCLLGVAAIFGRGADRALLKHFSGEVARETGVPESTLLQENTARLEVRRQLFAVGLLALGGAIGAINLKLAVCLSSVNYLVGAIVDLFIEDDSDKLRPACRNPLSDMLRVARNAFCHPETRWRLLAVVVGREALHSITWLVTPVLRQAGVPDALLGVVWVIQAVFAIIGALMAKHYAGKLKESYVFAIPVLGSALALAVVGTHLNILTVWLCCLAGVARGWNHSVLTPILQQHTSTGEQTSVLALASVGSDVLHILVLMPIGWAADIQTEYGLTMAAAIFLPLGLIVWRTLRRLETKTKN